ncbi:7038_t:CDS:2 [Funneliformis mosseae]|uniref:7038_t:CDS:1 n=1 Tax=Funneliformis mosseae TaxID=27381 RepID=A0A9N8YLH4_FUNMO|nr:7038_t:CDS:2 [Funneliformis mosseae]
MSYNEREGLELRKEGPFKLTAYSWLKMFIFEGPVLAPGKNIIHNQWIVLSFVSCQIDYLNLFPNIHAVSHFKFVWMTYPKEPYYY